MGLGDALKKAGLIRDKDLRRAKREKKRDEIEAGLATRKASEEHQAQERQRIADEAAARQEEQREAARLRNEELAAREHLLRLAQIAEANDLTEQRPGPDARDWRFVTRAGKIRKVAVSADLAAKLENGAAGIVERPDPDQPVAEWAHAIVDRATVERVTAIDPEAVRFHNARSS